MSNTPSTRPALRPSRGALMSVSLSRNEIDEWRTDERFRDTLVTDVSRRARAKGRRFFELLDQAGKQLHVGEVVS